MQSIFRYPGGKTRRAVQEWILGSRPYGAIEYREPFIGGGGIFFALHPRNFCKRWINDLHPGLVAVYEALAKRPEKFIQSCRHIRSPRPGEPVTANGKRGGKGWNARLARHFNHLRLNETCDQALRYFFLNRTVFGGRVNYDRESRLYYSNPDGWRIIDTDALEEAAKWLRGVQVTCGNYEPLFTAPGRNVWIYADPPYVVNTELPGSDSLYQHGFTYDDHRRLAEVIRSCPYHVSLSYDDCDLVRGLYPESSTVRVHENQWAYSGTTNKTKERGRELLIVKAAT